MPEDLIPIDLGRLQEILGGRALARVRARIRERIERGRPATGTTSFSNPSAEEREAVDRLLGRVPGRGRSLAVDLDALAFQLRGAGLASDLRAAVEAIDGPVRDLAAAAAKRERAWEAALDGATGIDAAWLAAPATRTLLRRLTGSNSAAAAGLLASAAAVIGRLPHAGTTRPVLAADALGDAHALDPGRPVATLVGSALAWGSAEDEDPWEPSGVFRQDLTRTVLALNLPAVGNGWLARLLRLHRDAGEPLHLTLRQLLRPDAGPSIFAGIPEAFVCENPAVVGVAAARLGAACAPLVCVWGRPGSAAHRLLGLLRDAGVTLRYHGDFDPVGLAITADLVGRHGAEPWRMDAADYLAALAAGRGSPAPEQRVPETPWSPDLAPALRAHRRAVHEEAVVEDLLANLRPRRA